MAFTDTWNESYPVGTDYANILHTAITQTVKRALRERLTVDHYFAVDETGLSNIGCHSKCTLLVQTSITGLANAGILYTKDVSAKAELHFKDEDGNEIQITSAGVVKNSVPSGLIALWHGTIATIPTGWVICDGNNSTPNLLNKFVRGVVTAATNPGTTGGADTHDHGAATGSHTLTQAEMPAHTHYIAQSKRGGYVAQNEFYTVAVGGGSPNTAKLTLSTGDDGGHTHTVTSASSLPAYYAVAFIMKS